MRRYRVGMYIYGHEFFEISRKTKRSPVKSYLLGHALELFLKSFLMKKGTSIKKLKKTFSHNIDRLLKESLKHDIEDCIHISDELKADIASFSKFYSAKHYEYFPILPWITSQQLPKTIRLSNFARQLDRKLLAIIKDS
ncbi:MAG: hypothetical protein PVJ60_07145 [Phycisphaerales bacterium]